MSYSFVIIDLENKVEMQKINSFFADNYSDYEVIYCSSNEVKNKKNVRNFKFDKNENIEKIVNSILCKCELENIVLVKKFTTCEDIKKLTDAQTTNNQVITFKNKKSKFANWISRLFTKIIKVLFQKDINETNYSCMLFAKEPALVLKSLEAPSNLTRDNSWQGVEIKQLESQDKYKTKYNLLYQLIKTIIPFILGVLIFASIFIFRYKTVRAFKLFQLALSLACFVIFAVFCLQWIIVHKVGEKEIQKAIILKGE